MGKTEDSKNESLESMGSDAAESKPLKHATPNVYKGVFFGHGQADRRKQRFTIAILPTDKNSAYVGVSVCSERDVFVKKIGRVVAEGRAHKRPTLHYTGPDVDTTTIEGMLNLKKRVKQDVSADICSAKELIYEKNVSVPLKGE